MSERIERIMKEYPQMVMERTCLQHQIRNFTGITETEMIDTMYFKQPEGERVQTSSVSDKTANIAITYRMKMERINKEWQEHLEKKYAIISDEITFFESALVSLSGSLSDIITDMVIYGLTWDELTSKYHISRTMVAKHRKKAIRELETLYDVHDKEVAEYLLS